MFSVIVGAIVTATSSRPIDRWLGSERFDSGSLFVSISGPLFLGGLSHLLTDMLSAPHVAQPIEPFWPLLDKPWSLDLIWYNSPLWNVGLLTVAILLHVAIVYAVDPIEHTYRITGT